MIRAVVGTEPRVALEYVEVRDAHELSALETLDGDVLLAVAARVGGTRLIDNVLVHVAGSTSTPISVSRDRTVRAYLGRRVLR